MQGAGDHVLPGWDEYRPAILIKAVDGCLDGIGIIRLSVAFGAEILYADKLAQFVMDRTRYGAGQGLFVADEGIAFLRVLGVEEEDEDFADFEQYEGHFKLKD